MINGDIVFQLVINIIIKTLQVTFKKEIDYTNSEINTVGEIYYKYNKIIIIDNNCKFTQGGKNKRQLQLMEILHR